MIKDIFLSRPLRRRDFKEIFFIPPYFSFLLMQISNYFSLPFFFYSFLCQILFIIQMYSVKSNSVIMYIVPLLFVVLKMGIKEISIKPDCIWLKSSAFVYVFLAYKSFEKKKMTQMTRSLI